MASTREYLDFVLEQLSGLDGIETRPMMGEYILYAQGKVVGGVYDDRLLLKDSPTARRLTEEAELEVQMELPYDGAKEMLLVDVDRSELLCRIVQSLADELPPPKSKRTNRHSEEEAE